MNNAGYQDFRVSYPLIVIVFILEVICIHNVVTAGIYPLNTFCVVVLFIFCLLFFSCTIEVERGSLLVSYGIGLFSMEVELHEITGYHIEKNRNLLSWMYNPFGQASLSVDLRSGGRLHLATDNPKLLQEVTKMGSRKR